MPLVLSLGDTKQSVAPSSRPSPFRYLQALMRSLSTYSSPDTQPRSLSLSHQDVLQAPTISAALIVTLPAVPCLPGAGKPSTGCSSPGQTEGRSTSPTCWPHCSVPPSVPLAFLASRAYCWLMARCWSTVVELKLVMDEGWHGCTMQTALVQSKLLMLCMQGTLPL